MEFATMFGQVQSLIEKRRGGDLDMLKMLVARTCVGCASQVAGIVKLEEGMIQFFDPASLW